MNLEKFLPIGTVVLLKGAQKKLMITGYFCSSNDNKEKMFDYSGILYPEGVINSDEVALFNHDQIEKVFYVGYLDDEAKAFIQVVKNFEQAKNAGTISN